jgi:hypothetical protein
MAVAPVIEEAEGLPTMAVVQHLLTTVVEAGRLRRAAAIATVVEAEGDGPLLVEATVAIGN